MIALAAAAGCGSLLRKRYGQRAHSGAPKKSEGHRQQAAARLSPDRATASGIPQMMPRAYNLISSVYAPCPMGREDHHELTDHPQFHETAGVYRGAG